MDEKEQGELQVLQWAEKHAEGAFKQLLESANMLHAQATTLATLLLGGLGGALSLGLDAVNGKGTPSAWGALASAVYFAVLVTLTVKYNLAAGSVPLGYNEPKNLVQLQYTVRQLLEVNLQNAQTGITELLDRNAARGANLNRLRYAAAATPLVYLLGAALARLLTR
jgi:hypothetical protein